MSVNKKPFLVRYFSDGTYDAYLNAKSQTEPDAPDTVGKEIDPVWGHILDEEPVKGTWDSGDGFFQLEKDGKRSYVGSVNFGAQEEPHPSGLTPAVGGWEASTGKINTFVTPDGNQAATGPACFRGNHYSGTPGGKLRAHFA